jgi:hypothetical protein
VLARNKKIAATIYMTRLTAPAIDWGETAPPGAVPSRRPAAHRRYRRAELRHPARCHRPRGLRLRGAGRAHRRGHDLGYIPESIKFHLRRTDLLLLEANHDLDMLKVGPYPWSVKQRVMSRVGHLSNLVMAEFLAQDLDSCTNNLVLGHLSEQNNHPAIVNMFATQALESAAWRRVWRSPRRTRRRKFSAFKPSVLSATSAPSGFELDAVFLSVSASPR